jgi:superfamily II DNA or RNA helicase
MDPRRRFNSRERTALYLAADGRCAECGNELEPGWHGDHVDPHSRGGATDVINGQALCPSCNLKKGTRSVNHRDRFQPRPFQKAVIHTVLDGMASGRDVSIVLASPGSGKTLAYQAAATYAHREGLADFVAVFVPRIILAQQCETSWRHSCPEAHCPPERRDNSGIGGFHLLFDAAGRMGPIRHVRNSVPLLPPGHSGIGFVSTYSSLVVNPDIYESWARRNRDRFLLVADEAQFCGAANDERSGGTQAGARITDLHQYAAHTLLLTGTPNRSDGQPLILADYDEPDERGQRKLLSHAEASYKDGIAEGYLRRFEATVHEARVRWKSLTRTVIEYDLSTSGDDLADVLGKDDVWQRIAEGVVAAVREKQRVHPDYRGLISCMEQKDAKKVAAYLNARFPGLRVKLAISEDGPEAERALREFQAEPADILVTVRKAFIGYDCPEITVVGVLTNYRDKGHLMQLVGRGLRMWNECSPRQQSCRVIAPDDPQMQEFIEFMRGESEEGLRERARREETERADRSPMDHELGYVESAHLTTARAVSNDAEVDNEDRMLIEAIKHDLGLVEDVTNLAKFLDAVGFRARAEDATPAPAPRPPVAVPLTELERIEQLNARTASAIRAALAAQGVRPGEPGYDKHISRLTAHVNSHTCKAGETRTVEQAEARLTAAMQLRQSVP